MSSPIDVTLFFNFRSPYCYLASKTLWPIVDDYDVNLVWKPVGGWDLRSSPERAQKKIPIARQDLARFARRLNVPVTPPPKETEPTLAGQLSLFAEEKGVLRAFITEVMAAEWGEGKNIGDPEVLLEVGASIGLDRDEMKSVLRDEKYLDQLQANAKEAEDLGVVGVPTFVIGDQIFWGQDRIDFVLEELEMLTSSATKD
ncbi:2-hydroxychromene-2-carboxylate isomerase [Neptuniibacter sp.]|uniref:2-hydroxychromene-2-carboxylate isomerase n=1 Tax=Neptuniibacter sp. TaxID=1962643 RepID=UPI0026023512|nr:2-hydroxychromene-2-carboxylate isomerase [Neptuniibacter sp.]MCP4595589.1 2-hydroxychromene-2-carboxylate isomerase [Neptuniibacter sp.]